MIISQHILPFCTADITVLLYNSLCRGLILGSSDYILLFHSSGTSVYNLSHPKWWWCCRVNYYTIMVNYMVCTEYSHMISGRKEVDQNMMNHFLILEAHWPFWPPDNKSLYRSRLVQLRSYTAFPIAHLDGFILSRFIFIFPEMVFY